MINKGKRFNKPRRYNKKKTKPTSLVIYGLHPVKAALNNPGRTILKIVMSENARSRLGMTTPNQATANIEIEIIRHPGKLDRLLPADAVHQGVMAEVLPLDDVILAETNGTGDIIILDQVSDPHNIGAIMRTAAAFDARAVVVTNKNSPYETGVLAKAASGALDIIPMVRAKNLVTLLLEIKDLGYKIVGLDAKADMAINKCDLSGSVAMVVGSEGEGIRPAVANVCQQLVYLPTSDRLQSLNVASSAAIALYSAHTATKV